MSCPPNDQFSFDRSPYVIHYLSTMSSEKIWQTRQRDPIDDSCRAFPNNGKAQEITSKNMEEVTDTSSIENDLDLGRQEPVQYRVSREEWEDLSALLDKLHELDINHTGVAVVALPAGIEGQRIPPIWKTVNGTDGPFRLSSGERWEAHRYGKLKCMNLIPILKGPFVDPTGVDKKRCYAMDLAIVRHEVTGTLEDTDDLVANFEKRLLEARTGVPPRTPVKASQKDVGDAKMRKIYGLSL
ncbi:hypothetical protein B0J14DRAFT_605161 [Halenospora varia]|nr:hypothetical protein B0J14DRAFT_605161 [Halenospora varia]